MEHYNVMKKNRLLKHVTGQMDLTHMMLYERNQTQDSVHVLYNTTYTKFHIGRPSGALWGEHVD